MSHQYKCSQKIWKTWWSLRDTKKELGERIEESPKTTGVTSTKKISRTHRRIERNDSSIEIFSY